MPDVAAPARTVAYGIDPVQIYDVRVPTADPTGTTVVVVHGGFWKAEWDRAHAAPQAQAFADAGHHVAVVEYRRTGMPGGGWPGTFADVSAAVDVVVADPALPDRTVLVGHSAGGHLVTLTATRPQARELAGVVALAGCVDLRLTRDLGLGDDAAARFMGAADDGAWRAADPAAHPALTRVVLVHGEADDTVPVEVSERYLDRQGPSAGHRLVRLPGVGHMEVIEPAHPAFAVVLDEVTRLAAT
ncbi:MAG TPA: alpha/beta hydrolase [Lapillicoccus sp.]|nr:alpha/beta hydrolase [Lapillicoccus sp.]